MMATRYCGRVRITMRWVNPPAPSPFGSHYRVFVSCPMTRHRRDFLVSEWHIGKGHAVDSSHAWNAIAAEVVRSLAYDEHFADWLGHNALAANTRPEGAPIPYLLKTTNRTCFEVLP